VHPARVVSQWFYIVLRSLSIYKHTQGTLIKNFAANIRPSFHFWIALPKAMIK